MPQNADVIPVRCTRYPQAYPRRHPQILGISVKLPVWRGCGGLTAVRGLNSGCHRVCYGEGETTLTIPRAEGTWGDEEQ